MNIQFQHLNEVTKKILRMCLFYWNSRFGKHFLIKIIYSAYKNKLMNNIFITQENN